MSAHSLARMSWRQREIDAFNQRGFSPLADRRSKGSSGLIVTEKKEKQDLEETEEKKEKQDLDEHFPLILPGQNEAPIVFLPFWHPKRGFFRWTVLFIACLFSVSSYFSYDAVGVIQSDLMEEFHLSSSQFGLLYSVYSFPNMILPFVGGFVLDKVGLPIGTTVTCFLVTLGSFIVALGPYFNSYYVMLVGRFIFGMGAETSLVAQNTICCAWFKDGKELALAMGLTVSAGRLGSYITFTALARVVNYYGDYRAALWLGAFVSSLSFLAGFSYLVLHYVALHLTKGMELNIPKSQPDIHVSEVLNFPKVFWLVTGITCMYYSSVFPFQSTATALLETTHDMSTVDASFYVSLLPLTSFFLSPIFGFIVDRVGRRVYFVSIGLAIMVPAFSLLITPDWHPLISMIAIGFVFAIVPAAIWPCLPILINEKYIGTAFGFLVCVINAGLTFFFWVQGLMPPSEDKIFEGSLFTSLAFLGLLLSIGWVVVDWKMENVCNQLKDDKQFEGQPIKSENVI